MGKTKGAVAAGHKVTANAAEEILIDGGNAFDAIVAAHFCACVVEPVLASLAGGGYMLGKKNGAAPALYDFFVHTPANKNISSSLDFFPIHADFGATQQEFHIGLGSAAVPGSVRGMFKIHKDLCSLPMQRLLEPAIRAAKEGVKFSHLQAMIFKIVGSIYSATPEAEKIYSCSVSDDAKGRDLLKKSGLVKEKALVTEGDILKQAELAETLEGIGREGQQLFYEGEIAEKIERLCLDGGGYLSLEDLKKYKVLVREPTRVNYRDSQLFTNSPPASGGVLIALALKLMEQQSVSQLKHGSSSHLDFLASVMAETNQARIDMLSSDQGGLAEHLLEKKYLSHYQKQVATRARCMRGTTHISVMDGKGNAAAMTVSNGEGCGYMIPGTGVMLNNMLGEEDLNPEGFHCWQENQRMTSMMSPSLLKLANGTTITLGSGGSNRIRTAILQMISNTVDFGMLPEQAISSPRIHYENGLLNIEPGFAKEQLDLLSCNYQNQQQWSEQNLFFGGVHAVSYNGKTFKAAGDSRRDGVGLIV